MRNAGFGNMTNQEIMEIARRQSAEDMGCDAKDFLAGKNIVRKLRMGPNARQYLKKDILANFISYGNNVVACVQDEYEALVSEYVNRFTFYECFETPSIHWLSERLKKGKICFMAEYYLPDVNRIPDLSCTYKTRLLSQKDFRDLYRPEFQNALCKDRKELDVLGVGAYDHDQLIGLAACSADCNDMWQIGIDVLPKYRKQGVASALTSALMKEILARGKVPFYCTAWSNVRSVRNAVKCGFIPAWVEMTVKPAETVNEMNEKQP